MVNNIQNIFNEEKKYLIQECDRKSAIVVENVECYKFRKVFIEMRTLAQAIKLFTEDNKKERNIEEINKNYNIILPAVNDLLTMLNEQIDQIEKMNIVVK